MRIIYNLIIAIYGLILRIAALFNTKAALFIKGRNQLFEKLFEFKHSIHGQELIWMHCASLGEFEQGLPVIEGIKNQLPGVKIVLTFFSPSGYELKKDFPLVDFVSYLPLDLPSRANRFVEILQPNRAIFVKYEFWLNHLRALHQQAIPVILISAVFRPDQPFFRFFGALFLNELKNYDKLFVQDRSSADLLTSVGIKKWAIAGDTRIDRVINIASRCKSFPAIETFAKGHQILVCGSTWAGDEAILLPFINQELPADWKVIIASHDIRENRIQEIIGNLKLPYQRYSQILPEKLLASRVLLIDNIGMLSSLYQYANLAYVGGGFGVAIHNTLEPMAFHIPVIFGPKFEKFIEARLMVARGGAFSIKNLEEFRVVFAKLQEEEAYHSATSAIDQFLQENKGSSEKILQYLKN